MTGHGSTTRGIGTAGTAAMVPGPVRPAGPSRYDLLLATIPLLLALAWVVGTVTAVPLPWAMAIGAMLAFPLLADGLAVNPPR